MPSTQGRDSPTSTSEGSEEFVDSQQESHDERGGQHQEPPTEPLVSSPTLGVLDLPPQPPLKDRDPEGGLSGGLALQDPPPLRLSQVVDFNTVAQATLTAAAELIAGNVYRPNVPMLNMANPGSLINQPIAVGRAGIDDNLIRIRPNSTTTSIYHHPESQTLLSSRPPPPERRQTGPGLTNDPIRGDSRAQAYFPDTDGNGEGDPVGLPSRLGSRNTTGRAGVPRPRSLFSPADGTLVGNGPGSRRPSRMMSGLDWLQDVPVIEELPRDKTAEDRLRPTIEAATAERNKYQKRSHQQGLFINGAIGFQIAVGAITTGVAASASGAHLGAAVASLGAISTILASYLAKVRGSGEPEFSTIRARELNTFLREVGAFIIDHGHETGTDNDSTILMYRNRFESIIKTEGEDSSGGRAGQSQNALSTSHALPTPPPVLVAGSPGAIPGHYAPGTVDEKQQLPKDEKVANGMHAV